MSLGVSQHNGSEKISVMLVDDSSVIRSALTRILTTDPAIDIVASVSNGEFGVSSAKQKKPDIVILDIEMPIMDGLTAIPLIKEASPNTKIVMFSSLTEKGAKETIRAFTLGAIECVAKPSSSSLRGQDSYFQDMLLNLIHNLVQPSSAPVSTTTSTAAPAPVKTAVPVTPPAVTYSGKPSIVAIGSSTGGPQALFKTVSSFSDFDVPIVITQHMPATFTKILAEHISQQTGLDAVEGDEGMVLENGKIYIAPGGKHMLFRKSESGAVQIKLDDGAPVNFCKPAVDPMMHSLIEIYGNKILNVILTGMGSDGLGGAQELYTLGGRIIVQNEETSVVWGMPGAVAQAGVCQEILPLDEIGPWVRKAVLG